MGISKLKIEDDRNIGCQGYYDEYNGDYDCDYEFPNACEDCIYGPMGNIIGNWNPETGEQLV